MPAPDSATAQTLHEIAAHQYTFRADPSVPSPSSADASGSGGGLKRERDEDGEKREGKGKAVNRVGRACNGCRKQKMRCEGADNPPCKRCRNANIPCQFEKPMREQQGDAQSIDRIQKLENTVGTIQSTLEELVSALKNQTALPSFAPPPPQQQPSPASATQSQSHSQSGHYASLPPQAHPSTPGSQVSAGSMTSPMHASGQGYVSEREMQAAQALAMSHNGQRSFSVVGSQQSQQSQSQQLPGSQQQQQQPRAESAASNAQQSPYLGRERERERDATASPAQRRLPYPNERPQLQRTQSLHTDAAYNLPPMSPASANGQRERLPPLSLHLESLANGGSTSGALGGTNGASTSAASASNPPSAIARSQGDVVSPKRPRPHAGPVNFSADIDSMGPPPYAAQSSSSTSIRPRSAAGGGAYSSNVTSAYSSDDEGELPTSGLTAPLEVLRSLVEHQEEEREERERRKAAGGRSRATSSVSGDWVEGEGRPLKRRKVERKVRPHAHPDVVTKGIITEEEARELFKIYFEHCSKFLPVFEPENDTYEELHRRSPFSVDAICMVASGVKDGSGGPSETTRRLIEEVKMISSNTLWLPVARREVVQASMVVASWSTNGWLLGGHAIRMALELGIHKAWPRLLKKIRSGHRLKDVVGSDEHDLVVCSRIWFALFLFEHQISFGTGRPFMIKTDESVEDVAAILQHPLSLEDDMRLVSSVELMIIREGLHRRLAPDGPVTTDTWDIIRDAEQQFGDWLARWDMQIAFKWPDKPFYRHSLMVQRFLSELFHNAVGLRGIKDEEDVENLPRDHWQRKLALQSIRVAQSALDICCRSFHYRDSLKYAPDYTHVTATFAASFLIRLARLFPKEADLSAILDDVSSLAKELANASAHRYANTLRRMIRIAQKRRVLPERVTVNGDRQRQDGPSSSAGAAAVETAPAMDAVGTSANGMWQNGGDATMVPQQQESLSPPEDLSLITGLPSVYPDPDFTEPALGGDHPLAHLYMPPIIQQQDQVGWFPPETSYSAFQPQAFGYAAVMGNWNIDDNGNEIPEIW